MSLRKLLPLLFWLGLFDVANAANAAAAVEPKAPAALSFPGAVGWEPVTITTVSAHRAIVDHCTFSWAIDENMSASGPRFKGNTPEEWRNNTSRDVTFSYNLASEGLADAGARPRDRDADDIRVLFLSLKAVEKSSMMKTK